MMHLPALLLLHLCSAANPVQRVLFVGNSYTYVNDLPNMYRQLAGSLLPDTTITVTSDTAGGRALEAAATVPSVLDKLAAGDFDFLVLQEQSTLSATPNSGKYSSYAWQRTMCEDAVRTVFAPAAKKANATVVFFETWGRRHNEAEKYTGHTTYLGMQRSVCDGYAVYADIARREACSTVATARAGEVYKKVYEAGLPSGDPSLDTASSFYQLYSGDGSHPAVSGTYAIAWSLFVAITHNAQQFNPQTTYTAGLPTEQASTLAQYAGEVYQEYRSVAPEITALRGAYPTGRYIIRKDVISVWGGPQDDVSNVYPLEVVNGSVFWAEQNASVVEVEEIPAKVTWSDGTVIANNAVVCEWRSATPATSTPGTAEPIATGAPVTGSPATSVTESPATSVTGTPATSVTGTPATSVTGTPATSVTGTPATSVTGTPATSVTGTPATSVTGTPATSVTGTPATSVTGTPATSVTGTPATSVTGTPATSVTGTPATSVTGTPATSVTGTPATSVTGTPATSVTGTPATSVTGTPATSVTGTPATSVTGTPATSVTGTPATSVTGTPATSVTGTPATSVTGTPATSVTGTPATSVTGTPATSVTGTPATSVTGTPATSVTGTPATSVTGTPATSVTGTPATSVTGTPTTATPATETPTTATPLRTLTPPTPTALHGTARCSTRPCETENTMCKEADGGHTCVSYAAAECCAERPACTSGLRASTQPCTEEEAVKGSCVWVALCCEEVFCREGGDDGTPVWVWVLVGVGAVVAILAAVAVASFLFCGAGKTQPAFSLMDEDFVAMEERPKDSV